jgi:hypothetical protein
LRPLQLFIEPPKQIRLAVEARDAFVLDGCQDGAAEHDLPTGIAPALGAARKCRQTVTCRPQPRETPIESFEPRANLLRRDSAAGSGEVAMLVTSRPAGASVGSDGPRPDPVRYLGLDPGDGVRRHAAMSRKLATTFEAPDGRALSHIRQPDQRIHTERVPPQPADEAIHDGPVGSPNRASNADRLHVAPSDGDRRGSLSGLRVPSLLNYRCPILTLNP